MENETNDELFGVEFEDSDDHSELILTFQALGELAGRKFRRHRAVSARFFLEPEHQLIHVEDAEPAPYISGEGNLDFSLPMRKSRLQLVIPYNVFPSFHYGDLIAVDVNLENEATGEPYVQQTETLIGTKTGSLENLSSRGMEIYLKSGIPAEERLAKINYWLEQNLDNRPILLKGIDMLTKLADSGSQEAAKKVLVLYSDSDSAVADKDKASKWKERVEEVGRLATVAAEKEEAEKNQLPDRVVDEASLKKCEQLAANGNTFAKWLIYQYSTTTAGASYDSQKAFTCLREAAKSGLKEAVDALAEAYTRHYVFITREQVADYCSVLKAAADKKEAQAQYLLSQIYYGGRCFGEAAPVDKKAAFSMLVSSANGGNVRAAFQLWKFFEDGNEFLMEAADALGWLKMAAEQGFAAAEARIGDLYIDGQLIDKDSEKGLDYLRKAAEQKNWDAQLILFQSYYDGRYKDILFKQDKKKAFNLLRQFADEGNGQASIRIIKDYLQGNEMMLEHREATEYLKKAAAAQYSPAMFELANLLLDGFYLPQDTSQAKKLLDAAAVEGYAPAQFALYQYYFSGYKSLKNAHSNRERAYKWLLKAAEHLPEAQYEIWDLSRDRRFVDLDLEEGEAADYLFRSAAQKYSPALYQIGLAFGRGKGVVQDSERGISLIEEAASRHYPEALFTLSEIHEKGEFGGSEAVQDEKQSAHLLLLSAELGYGPACRKVCELFAQGKLPNESKKWIARVNEMAAEAGCPFEQEEQARKETAAARTQAGK